MDGIKNSKIINRGHLLLFAGGAWIVPILVGAILILYQDGPIPVTFFTYTNIYFHLWMEGNLSKVERKPG